MPIQKVANYVFLRLRKTVPATFLLIWPMQWEESINPSDIYHGSSVDILPYAKAQYWFIMRKAKIRVVNILAPVATYYPTLKFDISYYEESQNPSGINILAPVLFWLDSPPPH